MDHLFLSLSSFSLSLRRFGPPPCCCGFSPPEPLPEVLSVSPWVMDPDPAHPPVILAIPAPSPSPSPSFSSPNQDPPSTASNQASSPPDQACPPPFPAPPPPVSLASAPASSAPPAPASSDPPVCQQPVVAMPSSVVPSPARHRSAVSRQLPAAPPVATPASSTFPPLPYSPSKSPPPAVDIPVANPADLLLRTQPVRPNVSANPLQPKSYAQAAKGSPGPGFVRAHARDVDSFARLPRTGINVIRGSREGIPTFAFVQSELPKVEGLYAKALVMKFHGGRPSLAASHKEISNWGLESPFSIGPLTSRSFLLRFQDERDLLKSLTRPSSTLINFPYKIFRWHNRCHIKEDSCMVPIWMSLPRLPLQCFAPEFLESIANTIGRFLCLDKATATLARPSDARMCVELDLRKERLQFIWIDLFDGFKQPIVYERVPKFCSGCHVQGHSYVECSKSSLDTLQSQDSGLIPTFQERTHPVRRNAKVHLAVVPQVNTNQSPASSVAAAAAHPQQHPPDPFQHQPLPPHISPVIPSSMQQCDPPPHPPAPSPPAMLAAAQFQTAVHPILQSTTAAQFQNAVHPFLQSTVASESHPTLPPPSSNYEAISSSYPSPAAAVPTPASTVLSSTQQPTRPNIPPAAKPSLQSNIFVALQQQLTQSPATAKASYPFSSIPEATVPPVSSEPRPSAPPPLKPEVHLAESTSELRPAAVRSSPMSAQAAPFPPSEPDLPSMQSSPHHNQPPSSSLSVYYNSNGARYATALPQKSLPNRPLWEMVNRQQGIQGSLSSIRNAPSPSYNHHQIHSLEGYESEGSFETDSQPNSPLESPKEDATKCPFPPQSCASEGEQSTEDHPGFQGHISDVDFYHRPMSSKKNKRQPDGPLRVQLRARKGSSSILR